MDRKKSIIQLRKRKPLLTGSEIGRKIGVSRQYVSNILKEEGLHNKQPTYKKIVVLCKICEKATPRGQRVCPTRECKDKYYNVDVTCTFCQYPFKMKRGHIIQRHKRGLKHIYCSQSCYSKGKHDGIS